MRRLTYLLAAVAGVLALMTLLTTNLLASNGDNFKSLTEKRREKQDQINELKKQAVEAQSLGLIRKRAEKLGLTQDVRRQIIEEEQIAQASE